MKLKIPFIAIVLIFTIQAANAQTDSLTTKPKQKTTLLKTTVLPISLITGGLLISGSAFEKSFQESVRNSVGEDFSTSVDNYTRYAPIVELYAADALGIKAKNHWFDQTKNLTLSIIITDFITFKIKKISNKTRPNGNGNPDSMPSAHTSSSFTNATVLYQEFKDTSPLLAYSGYGFAATTGALRITNNAHWLSDVLVGAGIGMLVTNVIYYFDPIIKWNPFKKTDNITLLPEIDNNRYGFYLCVRIK
ncbi:phosphatase PAP2 family protein [Flavobacterium soyangense]|uniref:Phosphatase PAP2 family protein n=1 Tax=Flavobacterium soyangense TaxID=2023265 RepID=A0A930XUC1_9FLAO|nr:phosphatase PAP2 family protein [Flavobacterium soyangense]MBF2707011.1 phosphatase PAP2 family protein [Flavobacterium soyangense]